jgi:hypothetical protein
MAELLIEATDELPTIWKWQVLSFQRAVWPAARAHRRARWDSSKRRGKKQEAKSFRIPLPSAGAGDRIRTDDLLFTRQLLYQLSYTGAHPF